MPECDHSAGCTQIFLIKNAANWRQGRWPVREPDLLSLFVHPLEKAGIRYLVAGSVGAMHYSEPRLTLDVDIPILITPKEISVLLALFPEPEYYCPPSDLIASEIARDCRGHFNVIHIPTGLKADFYPGNRDATLAWGWRHRIIEKTPEGSVNIAPPEYIILWKVIFYKEGRSEKHLRDIQRMLEIQSELHSNKYLEEFINEYSLNEIWEIIKYNFINK
jgi:hypothetical protein